MSDVMFSIAHWYQIFSICVLPLGCHIVSCTYKISCLFVLCFTNKLEHHGWVLGTSASYIDNPNVEFSYQSPDVFSERFCVPSHSPRPKIGMLCHKGLSLATPLLLTFWHRSSTFNSNKSPTRCNNFSVYYFDFCLQPNMFRAFSRPSLGAQ
jgi:hypothetical protein